MKTRACTVAGMFYPAGSEQLKRLLSDLFRDYEHIGDASGVVSPHAGYIYSGSVAAQAFSAFDPRFSGTFIVIGPSHQGLMTCISAIPWETPLGLVETDTDLAACIDIPVDEGAMSYGNENSLEVQMPFIKYRFPDARILPIMIGRQTLSEVDHVSKIIIDALDRYHGQVKIVASSDFSHYVSHEKASKDDMYAIDALISMDVEEFFYRIRTHRITACGYGPVGCMLSILKKRGAARCDLLKYATSGEVSGDYNQVVGYAALAVK
jgi:MEMO1 family protein